MCATVGQQSQVEALFDEYTTKVDMKKFENYICEEVKELKELTKTIV